MYRRLVLIAATSISTSAFAADAPKAPVQHAVQSQNAAAPVVLASADPSRPAAAPEPQATPSKPPRIGRVTTCRCGGQDADPDPEDQAEQ